MKIFIILLSVITFSGCYKPALLYNQASIKQTHFCVQVNEDTRRKQNIYEITGFKSEIHKYNEHYYYYYISDYINASCNGSDFKALILKAKVGSVFQTRGKGRSYRRLIFDVMVKLYRNNQLLTTKSYKTESETKVSFFTASKEKKADLVSQALANGYEDIWQQIDIDIKALK